MRLAGITDEPVPARAVADPLVDIAAVFKGTTGCA
jgi:hypothetical protein